MSVKVNKNQNQRIRPPWPIAKSMPCRKQQKDAEEKFANNQLNDDCSLGEALSSPTKWIASLMPATLSGISVTISVVTCTELLRSTETQLLERVKTHD